MDNNNIIDIVPEKWNTEQDTEQTEKPKKPFELFGIIDALFVDKEKKWRSEKKQMPREDRRDAPSAFLPWRPCS